jgi:hypothetical protein
MEMQTAEQIAQRNREMAEYCRRAAEANRLASLEIARLVAWAQTGRALVEWEIK